MTNVVLNNVSTFVNDTTAVNTVNNNSAAITTALSNCLARDAEVPNQMNTNLDMNSNQILNLPAPTSANSPARLVDIVSNPSLTLTIPPIGTSGAVVGLLNGNNTYSGVSAFTGATSFNPTPTFVLAPATNTNVLIGDGTKWNSVGISGTNTLSNTGVLTAVSNSTPIAAIANQPGLSVIANAGTSSAAIAPVTGTTRQVLAVNTAGTALAFAQPRGDQLLGTATNDSATAGNVGEYIESVIPLGSAKALTSGAALGTNALNLTSLVSLSAGDWDIMANATFVGTASTAATCGIIGLSTTSAVFDQTLGRTNITTLSTLNNINTATTANCNSLIGPLRFSLSTPTTIYCVTQGVFSASTLSVYGILLARRVR